MSDSLKIRLVSPYSEHGFIDVCKPGYIYLIHYASEEGKEAFAICHGEFDNVFIFDEDNDNNHSTINISKFEEKFNIISVYRCNIPFTISAVSCIAFESLENRDYYDILMGSFLNKDYKEYTLEKLIEDGSNPWFEKIDII